MLDEERRKFTRVPFSTRIIITAESKSLFSERMRDISLGGRLLLRGQHTA